MPRYVDHDARREQVALIAADLVATFGAEALTFRQVAEAAGCSTAIVSHYFADKRDLLLSTYRTASSRSLDRFIAAANGDGEGDSDRVRACLESLLPLDEKRRKDWSLWFAFWGIAVFDPTLAAEQRDRVRTASARIRHLLEQETPGGRGLPPPDSERAARRLLLLVHGIGTQALFDPGYWSPSRQRQVLGEELDIVGLPATAHPHTRHG